MKRLQAELNPPPVGLSKSAAELWRQIVGEFELENQHLAILAQAVKCLTRIDEAAAQIKADGLFIKDRFDQQREHPAVAVEATNRRLFKSFMRELQLDIPPADQGWDRAPRLVNNGRQLKRA